METYRRHKRTPDPQPYVEEMRGTAPGGARGGRKPLRELDDLGYTDKEREAIRDEVQRLFRHFHTPVVFGARYRAPCPVWRSERIVLRNDRLPRFATRVCIFHGDPRYMTAEEPSGQVDEMGGFLGFVSIRPTRIDSAKNRFVAVAHISCPSHMKRPRYHILNTALGPPDGIMPFRGTPYYQPWVVSNETLTEEERKTMNRALCLQASLYSALLLKSSTFHCTPVSSHDLMALLWDAREEKISMRKIAMRGLTLEDCERVLSKPEVHAGCRVETVTASDFAFEALKFARESELVDVLMHPERQPRLDEVLARAGLEEAVADKLQADLKWIFHRMAFPNADVALEREKGMQALRGQAWAAGPAFKRLCEAALELPADFAVRRKRIDREIFLQLYREELLPEQADHAAVLIDDLLEDPDVDVLKDGAEMVLQVLNDDDRRKSPGVPLHKQRRNLTSEDVKWVVGELRRKAYAEDGLSPHLAGYVADQNMLAKRESRLCVAEYLANGMPVIASIKDKSRTEHDAPGHSVLVVGMHFQNPAGTKGAGGAEWSYEKSDTFLPSSYVVHDINHPPFWEVPAKNLLTAGWFGDYDERRAGVSRSFSYLAVTPRGARCGIRDVRVRALAELTTLLHTTSHARDYVESFKPAGGLQQERLCCRTRLLNVHDILHWYVKPVAHWQATSEEDLLNPANGVKGYAKISEKVRDYVLRHPSSHMPEGVEPGEVPATRSWWCVECHSESFRSSSFRDYHSWQEPVAVYCWRIDQDLTDPAQVDPEFVILAEKRGESSFTMPDGERIVFDTRFPPIQVEKEVGL